MGYDIVLTIGALSLTGIGIAAAATLKGWQGWLELRRMQVGHRAVPGRSAGARTDLADLKARLRRLEAIANGAEL